MATADTAPILDAPRIGPLDSVRRRATRLGCSLALLLPACGGAEAPAPATPVGPAEPVTARQLLPLEHDTVFSYETLTDTGDTGIMILQIRRPRADLAELDVAGRVQRFDVDDTSVMHSSGGYLLKDPITAGASFPGAFGAVTVLEMNKPVRLPAGSFERCVVTREESSQPFKRADSTYCPGVGLVSLVVEASGDADVLRVESRLKSHGPRVSFR